MKAWGRRDAGTEPGPEPGPEPGLEPRPEPVEPTTQRQVLHLDPDLELPAPAPLAPPILVEPGDHPGVAAADAPPSDVLPAPLLDEPVPVAPLPPPLLTAPALEAPEEDTPTSQLPVVPATDAAPEVSPETAPEAAPVRPTRTGPRFPWIEIVVLVALATATIGAFAGVGWLAAVVVLLLAAAAGLAVLAHQPVLVLCAMALFLGAAPGVQVPVLGVSVMFALAAASWVALAVMPEIEHRVSWAAGLSAVLIGLAVFAFLGNPVTGASISDFIRWSVTAAAVYPLTVLPAAQLARVGRWFVGGCTAAAAFGIALVTVDRDGSLLDRLSVLGYSASGGNGRFTFGENGNFARLTSTYVDPNLGGFIMAVGLVLALALLRGPARAISVGLLGVAITLTLSRADIGTVAVAALLLVLFGGVSAQIRGRLLGLGLVGGLALLAVPAVRSRLTNSFGANDRGSSARWEAFEIFPDQMSGHWVLGRGFGAPELTDAAAAAATNYVANAPLLTVYRGGLVVGLAFLALMLTATLHGWRLMRRPSFEHAVVGAGYLGVMLVALQLDFPVVTLSPATLAFALLLAFLSRPDAVLPASATASAPALVGSRG